VTTEFIERLFVRVREKQTHEHKHGRDTGCYG